MEETKLIKWWKYASFWKLFGVALSAMACSLISVLLIPNLWCLIGVFVSCGVGGCFMNKLISDVLRDLIKELE